MTESIKIENPQQQFVPIERAETISWIGYTQRPINQRKQVRNVYLDSIFAQDTDRVINSATLTTIPSYNYYSKVWNYNRDKVDWQVFIPLDWTYNISFFVSFEWNKTWIRIVTLNINWTPVDLDNYVCDWVNNISNYLHVSQPYNLKKWDIITIDVYQSSWIWLKTTTNIKVIKIS